MSKGITSRKRQCSLTLQRRIGVVRTAANRWMSKRHATHDDAHHASMAEQHAYRALKAAMDGRCSDARALVKKASIYIKKAPSRAELKGLKR